MTTQNIAPKRSAARPMGAAQAAWLVAEREISTKLRSKAFLISTGVLLLLVLGAVVFGGIMSNTGGFGGSTKVAAPAQMSAQLEEAGFEVTAAEGEAAVNELVEAGDVDAGVVLSAGDSAGATVVSIRSRAHTTT